MTNRQIEGDRHFQVAQGAWGLKLGFVNVYFIAGRQGGELTWVLVDTGPGSSVSKIVDVAAGLFGKDEAPAAIVLTHGHFDHAGGVQALLKTWDVPVYAHGLEAPYLTGKSAYPPADPTAGGGLMTLLSWLYPNTPIDLGSRLQFLSDQDRLPFLPEWRVIHTPGHSPGHVSLFRELNATLIAGDAFVTIQNESVLNTLSYRKNLSGPPKYFTSDWGAAERSVNKLAALEPRIAATGHGQVMSGKELRTGLSRLSNRFEELAVPEYGRYVNRPAATDENGIVSVPPFRTNPHFTTTLFLGAAAIGLTLAAWIVKKRSR